MKSFHLSFGICVPAYAALDYDMTTYHWLCLGIMTIYWERPYPSSVNLSYRASEPTNWGCE